MSNAEPPRMLGCDKGGYLTGKGGCGGPTAEWPRSVIVNAFALRRDVVFDSITYFGTPYAPNFTNGVLSGGHGGWRRRYDTNCVVVNFKLRAVPQKAEKNRSSKAVHRRFGACCFQSEIKQKVLCLCKIPPSSDWW